MTSVTVALTYVILGIIGVWVSSYIYYKKQHKQPLVCNIIGDDCSKVVNSKYGKTFGIENTILGALYYGGVAIYGVLLSFGLFEFLSFFVFIASGFGFLFSLYLLYVQIYVIKEYCQYCLLSALLSVFIFLIPALVYLI